MQVWKLLTDRPATAVVIMKHIWEQGYKHPEKRELMSLYWKQNVQLAEIVLDIGKQKGRKDQVKLVQCVNKLKQKYVSLRQAFASLIFHGQSFIMKHMSKVDVNQVKRHMYINCPMSRLSQSRIIINQTICHFHYLTKNTREKGS